MKTLHFDCFAGISGDMSLGALVDLGVDPDELRDELNKLNIGGWKLDFTRDERNGISGTHAMVILQDAHDHEHDHHHGHDHGHAHNSWKEIRSLIERSAVREGAKNKALDIFTRIAEAESQVHGIPVNDIGFHEVGALDSIIDIVGVAICLDILKPDRITSSIIELGGGTVKCAHGILPVPAPAVVILLKGLPVSAGGFDKEMTTPTGAAILASCVDEFITGPVSYKVIKTGIGIGGRKMDKPNMLRASWREAVAASAEKPKPWKAEELLLMETNIDDMTGEALGFLMEKLFEAGALDVTFASCVMKKSRPGTLVSVLCGLEDPDPLRDALFRYSTTIGFRETRINRLSLGREEKILEGEFGKAREKIVYLGEEKRSSKIEFEDRARIAREKNISLDNAERLIRSGEDN
ncbi:nickel pincer cofactor biosynthesis protein LarC [Leadbettera azotonutricia]|uniref:Putative nickel insertion protein n=1 Tax=Leadbettera azotonutricia (strain ATCC BAA-888 / DSM 13862 / ZAS-9) TaxID=545695 RepID=F5YB55_LEAAZ|nr:nickel pincer cofactor biosynthesis protein LarC [Leadbettera azotonutricia]AEF83259.1 conserved hypothetical protein [Leadbettera azotonutricia ZAS-9]